MKEVIVKDADLQQAAMESMDAFVHVFVKAIYDAIGGELTSETMAELNADQLTLLAWDGWWLCAADSQRLWSLHL